MKTFVATCALGLAVLLAGTAIAGDPAASDQTPRQMKADTDGDGRVSRAEASAAGTQRSGEWFDKLDLDKDGYITQEEMRQARETRRGAMREKGEEHFKQADANGDGQLSLDEVQAKMPKLADRFATLDKDSNGFLSKDELRRGPRHGPQPQS